jgi:hypothetical protein
METPQNHAYTIRCLHTDPDRPATEPGEFHWRCPAVFAFDPHAEHDWQRSYCPHHRPLYVPQDVPYRPLRAAASRADRLAAARAMTPGVIEKPEEPTSEDVKAAAEKKEQQVKDAKDAGLLE